MTTPGDVRRHVEELLDAMDGYPLDLPADNESAETLRRIPVIQQGKTIGHVTEPAGDYRAAAQAQHHSRVRELRRVLSEGGDPHRVAWLALEVGAGMALPAVMRRIIKHRSDVKRGHAKAGKTKANADQEARLLEKLAQQSKGTFSARLGRAIKASGWPYSESSARRAAAKAGMK